MPTHSSILLIEDSPGECELFRLALAQTGLNVALYTEHDADAALHFLATRAGHEPLPSLILLDWNLRTTRGDRFLQLIRSDARFASIPVVIFTTSDDASDLAAGYGYGANGYVVKPGTFQALVTFIHDLCGYWLHWNRTMYQSEIRC
jgi:DNA-binding response OmpR family regulator